MTRTFDDRAAVREKTPILLGLVGPSGTGKTFSALRLATGIQRVSGGEIFVIDTEARRALHYADKFKFRHVPFGAPFSPLDYLAAIQHCVSKGAGVIVVDSMSHEHEGPGGVLEMHESESKRLAQQWRTSTDKVKMAAWQKPKGDRRKLINTILQIECNFIFCFRSKEKLKIIPGKEPQQLGFMPIAGEEFVYEMTAKMLLLPGANGQPTWQSDNVGERAMIKLPDQFRSMFNGAPVQLSEDIGEQFARWAAGGASPGGNATTPAELLARYAACSDDATYRTLENARRALWPRANKDEKAALKAAADATATRLSAFDSASNFAPGSSNGKADAQHDPETGEIPPADEPQ